MEVTGIEHPVHNVVVFGKVHKKAVYGDKSGLEINISKTYAVGGRS